MSKITFELRPVAPFRLDLTTWALRRRATNAIDRWDGETFRRVLVLDKPVEVAVSQVGLVERPRLAVAVTGARLTAENHAPVRATLEKLLGLRIDLAPFYLFAARDKHLGTLAERFRGMKPPRYASLFDTLITAIACQQITLTQGISILNRLAERYGVSGPDGTAHAFPRPENLAGIPLARLRQVGLTEQKARAVSQLAREINRGSTRLEGIARLDNEAAAAELQRLRGVGRWTAEYALLRGLGRLDVFPFDDVGARNNVARWLGLPPPLDDAMLGALLAQWRPFAGLVYLHLLLDGLATQNPTLGF